MRADQVGFMRELGLGGVGQAERPGWVFLKGLRQAQGLGAF